MKICAFFMYLLFYRLLFSNMTLEFMEASLTGHEHIISDLYSQLHGVQGGAGAVEVHPGVARLVGYQPAVPAHVGLPAQPQGDQPRARGAHASPDKYEASD